MNDDRIIDLALVVLALLLAGCSSSKSSGGTITAGDAAAPDAGSSGTSDAGTTDASCSAATPASGAGEACTGFGAGDPCDPACMLPPYGYVCANGGPPGFAGCVRVSQSALGDTFCCAKNDCVAQPDQDMKCAGASAAHRYQCPPGPDGNPVPPPKGCVDGGAGATALEQYYCCP